MANYSASLFVFGLMSFVAGTVIVKWLEAQGIFEFKKRL